MQNNNYKTEYKDYGGHIAIMISTDRNIFVNDSVVQKRMLEYSKMYKELHIIVFAKRSLNAVREIPISFDNDSKKLKIYSTQSKSRFFYIFDAYRIGKKLINNLYERSAEPSSSEISKVGGGAVNNNQTLPILITCQDPFETGIVGLMLSNYTKKINLDNSLMPELLLQLHTDVFSPYFSKHSFLNKARVEIARFTLPYAHVIRVVSRKIADSIAKEVKSKIKDLPTLEKIILKPIEVSLDYIKGDGAKFNLAEKHPQIFNPSSSNSKPKILLMVSRLESEKNIDMAIKAFKLALEKFPNMYLIIVGDGTLRKSLEKLSKDLQISERVLFTGWLNDPSQIVAYYKASDLLLVTSWYEGYGMVFKEAEAMGLKIVSTDVGIAREVGAILVGHNKEEVCGGILGVVGNI